ncbi:glucodextranase DOMON-like domain-containing protein [Deinococcus wulumuqiensis]|uniref:Glucodextranase-like C-terminal domain-containing protein n=1 Tax=Deinococcus wulumuqiensis TaxID=980427 RepID=A0AAV4K8X6_9DEIO|nr:glucodextranase DOMON-like domain-containing protein [Deinococcus wulumuqiensis]GGI82496.1 hypothetical protein GCM10010914_16010 [Deinococcus wulumuqiensis]GGP29468.1 hypothetical protein GCM10008021_11190 [Deinococcus wulumuqiensis]
MPLLTLFAAALTFADPAGDAHGDGGYLLPQRPAVSAEALDLRSFEARPFEGGTRFTVGFGGHQNPWELASGFSAGVTDIFVKTDAGGERSLPGLNLRTAGESGWQYHVQVSGAGASLEHLRGEQLTRLPPPRVRMEGTDLIIEAPELPFGRHAYWVTSSVYTPLSRDGHLVPTATVNPSGLQANADRGPVPVDVLADPADRRAYTEGVLGAVGQTRDWRLTTLAGLGALGLTLTGLSLWRSWQARDRG